MAPDLTEIVTTRPPFERRVEDVRGGVTLSLSITSFGRDYEQSGPSSVPLILGDPPVPVGLRPDLTLPRLGNRVHVVGHRRILDRACTVLETFGSATASALPSSGQEHDDVCVDGSGLVLADSMSGRVATRVETDPALPADTFDTSGALAPVNQGGGSVRAVDPSSRPPGAFWELGGLPGGFTLMGRYAVIPPSSDPDRRAGVDDVLRSGADLIVVERGATLQGSPPFGDDPPLGPIDLGPLGTGQVLGGLGYLEVRALLPRGHYVRVFGTADVSVLATIARGLRTVPGGQLTYLS